MENSPALPAPSPVPPRRVLRYEVPVDDRPHAFPLTSGPVGAACAPDLSYVEFWVEDDPGEPSRQRSFQVYGTGHPLPPGATWRGTCDRVRTLVFHLYEVTP